MSDSLLMFCVFKDNYVNIVELEIPADTCDGIGNLFTALEKAKTELNVVDYSVFQPTVNQVI